MTKKSIQALVALLVLFVLGGHTLANDPIIVGVYQNPPLVFIDEQGEARGLVIDALEAVADREDWQIEYAPCEWTQCLDRLERGDIDLLGAIAYSDERSQRFDFTDEALITNWGQVYAAPGAQIESLLDLDGKTLAVLHGDIYADAIENLLREFGIDASLTKVEDYPAVFALLDAGEVDAGVVNRLFARQHARDYDVHETAIIFHPIEVRYAATKGVQQDLLASLDAGLRELKADQDSAYYRSFDTWFGNTVPQPMPRWPLWAGGILAGLLLIAFAGNLMLRAQVRARTRELQIEVAERSQTQEELARERNLLRTLIDIMPDLIYAKDRDSRFILANAATARSLGVSSPEDVIGKTDHDFHPKELADQYHLEEEEIFHTGRPMLGHEEVILDRASGQQRWLSSNKAPLRDKEGDIVGLVGINRDITQRVQAEQTLKAHTDHLEELVNERTQALEDAHEQLLRSEKLAALGQLAGGVGHDLRNPLGIISNAAFLLRSVNPEPDEITRECLDIIDDAVARATDIIGDLMDFARTREPDREQVLLLALIENVLRKQPAPDQVVVSIDMPADLRPAFVDQYQIERALTNLITNAYQAMPEGGELRISASMSDAEAQARPWICLHVTDSGVGIPPENMQKLFEPLFTTKARGIGLGLATTKTLIEANGGRITVESEAGKGTVFTICLPTAE